MVLVGSQEGKIYSGGKKAKGGRKKDLTKSIPFQVLFTKNHHQETQKEMGLCDRGLEPLIMIGRSRLERRIRWEVTPLTKGGKS